MKERSFYAVMAYWVFRLKEERKNLDAPILNELIGDLETMYAMIEQERPLISDTISIPSVKLIEMSATIKALREELNKKDEVLIMVMETALELGKVKPEPFLTELRQILAKQKI